MPTRREIELDRASILQKLVKEVQELKELVKELKDERQNSTGAKKSTKVSPKK